MKQKLLLHICCGPCASPILPNLNSKFEVTGYYFNPNIFPETEFAQRLDSARKVAEFNGIKLVGDVGNEGNVGTEKAGNSLPRRQAGHKQSDPSFPTTRPKGFLDSSLREVARNDNAYSGYLDFIGEIKVKPERCFLCYKLRLGETAKYAKANGFDCFSTTLLISPFQYQEELKKIGEEIGEKSGIKFHYQDFRPLYSESREIAKELGLYMQKYCGCKFSRKRR